MPFFKFFRGVVGAVGRKIAHQAPAVGCYIAHRAPTVTCDLPHSASANPDFEDGYVLVGNMNQDDEPHTSVSHIEAKPDSDSSKLVDDDNKDEGKDDDGDWYLVELPSNADDGDWFVVEVPAGFESCGGEPELVKADDEPVSVEAPTDVESCGEPWDSVDGDDARDEEAYMRPRVEAAESCRKAQQTGLARIWRELWADCCYDPKCSGAPPWAPANWGRWLPRLQLPFT
ncbi:hypothetical protein K490DRAFT_55469 [Saccharata proteae CBS 121410]|uniref:Uncharacterized protein n=1 Tax=Saccharata proteae CBS 121410 TaxID=1314787 RepID=A0A6A5YAF8_9PEZI|nr:hypothetical protein K490DRAFT_55469 [Saccharata proteae CBS 121410]